MNLSELFEVQAKLDNHIIEEHGLKGKKLIKKKTVALLCELYECVNEARFFKFWSDTQNPKEWKNCNLCTDQPGNLEFIYEGDVVTFECPMCHGYGEIYVGDLLLEEYVDILHFALSIANDQGYTSHYYSDPGTKDLNDLTIGITNIMTLIPEAQYSSHIEMTINYIIKFGDQLGFNEKDVIDAYYSKNKVNYKRQAQGY